MSGILDQLLNVSTYLSVSYQKGNENVHRSVSFAGVRVLLLFAVFSSCKEPAQFILLISLFCMFCWLVTEEITSGFKELALVIFLFSLINWFSIELRK